MVKLLKVCIITTALSLLSFGTAYAADAYKIGVLDMQQIMKQSPEVASLNKKLQGEFKPRQEKIVASQKVIQADMEKFKKDASVMSDADKTKLEGKVNAEQAAYAKEVQSFQQDLSKAQGDAMQKFMSNLQAAVETVAKKGSYTMIVNHAAVPYFDPSLNVTQQILDTMSK